MLDNPRSVFNHMGYISFQGTHGIEFNVLESSNDFYVTVPAFGGQPLKTTKGKCSSKEQAKKFRFDMTASEASDQILVCRSLDQIQITEVRLRPTSDGQFQADISIYNKFSHVPNPPPVLKTYLEVGQWKHNFMKNDSDGYFNLIDGGSHSHLQTDTIDNLDMTCGAESSEQ